MEVTVTFRHMRATKPLREYAEERVEKLAKYLHRPIDAHVILSVEKRRHIAEVVLNADRATLNATEETGDLYSSIDAAVATLEQQARKLRSRRKSHKGSARSNRSMDEVPVPEPVPATQALRMDVIRADSFSRRRGPDVMKSKKMQVRPMTIEEAVMQMDLMNNEFLVFHNAASAALAVVYRRKDGNYGLIEPDE